MPTRQKLNARQRRPIVAELYIKGKTQSEIAKEFDTTQATISRDLKAIQEVWLEQSVKNYDEAISQELAKIDNLERTYWQAWEDSKEDAVTETVKGRQRGKEIDSAEKTIQKKGQVGNKSFLDGVQWCIERRCKLLGLDSPDRIEHSGGVTIKGYTIVSPEDWDEDE